MELQAIDAPEARARAHIAVLDIFVGLMALAVLASLFMPWFVAEYRSEGGVRACFDGSLPAADGVCTQTWSAWRTISPAWAIPFLAFMIAPSTLLRILGEREGPGRNEWLTLSGGLLAVGVFALIFVPDISALNEAQAAQAAIYSADPWIYTSIEYGRGIFTTIGWAGAALAASIVRVAPGSHPTNSRYAGFALMSLAAVSGLIAMSYVGDLVTRF